MLNKMVKCLPQEIKELSYSSKFVIGLKKTIFESTGHCIHSFLNQDWEFTAESAITTVFEFQTILSANKTSTRMQSHYM